MPKKQQITKTLDDRIASGEIIEQKSWQFIKELNSGSEEQLDALALTGGTRDYTYRQMFRKWERYAEVFSALQITDRNGSRVGMVSAAASEAIMAFYALNMTGASVSMVNVLDLIDADRWEKTIQKEQITDVILCDQNLQLQPELLGRVMQTKDKLGLRNVIVLHNAVGGPLAPQGMGLMSRLNYLGFKRSSGALFMDELLKRYEAYPITYASETNIDDALIIHTSGTTSGIHKPIPLSDRGFNEAVARLLRNERFASLRGNVRTCMIMDLSGSYGVVDMMHLPFAFGGTLVTIPMGAFNPRFAQAIAKYGINVFFGTHIVLTQWMESGAAIDLSSLSLVVLGGAYLPAEAKKRYEEFLRKCGCKVGIVNGYGLSEVGGACILADPGREDAAIGYPLPGVKVKIFNEDDEKFYDLSDGERTGVLFLSTPSVSCGRIGSEVFFELDEVDGERYLNTYDLVAVNGDGSMTCIGRMNKFFVNNEGVRFDAGLVESAVSDQPDIEDCGLAPEYDKFIHDTVPVLYVQLAGNPANSIQTVRQALYNVFVRDGKIAESNLPGQCVITDRIPYTPTGKVDVYSIIKGNTKGTRLKITPVRRQGRLVDVVLEPALIDGIGTWSGITEELDNIDASFIMNQLGSQESHTGPGTAPQQGTGSPFPQGVNPELILRMLKNLIPQRSAPGQTTNTTFEEVSGTMLQFLMNLMNMMQMNPQAQGAQGAVSQGAPAAGMGCQLPFMPQQGAQGAQTQGAPAGGMGCQLPFMPQQGAQTQGAPMAGMGCQLPFMPQQGAQGAQTQGAPAAGMGCQLPFMPQQGMGFRPPFGPQPPMGIPFMPQGFQPPFGPRSPMMGIPFLSMPGVGILFSFLPRLGMNFQAPNGQQNASGQQPDAGGQSGAPSPAPGMGCNGPTMPQGMPPFMSQPGMGCQLPFMPQQGAPMAGMGCQLPFMQQQPQGANNAQPQGANNAPAPGMGCNGPAMPQMPFMPRPGMGFQPPFMPQQGGNNPQPQGANNAPAPGMGCNGPTMPQGMPFMPRPGMGFQPPFMPQQSAQGAQPQGAQPQGAQASGMGCNGPAMPQKAAPDGSGAPEAGKMPDMSKLMELLGLFFNASTYDSFYED